MPVKTQGRIQRGGGTLDVLLKDKLSNASEKNARKELVFMLSDTSLEIILQNNTCLFSFSIWGLFCV